MLNKERIRQMTALARYEQEDGKKEMKISRYYRTDYWLMDGMDSMNLWLLLFLLAAVYVGMLIVYSAVTIYIAVQKHKRATKNMKKYTQGLGALLKEYGREERRQRNRRNPE